MNEDSYPSPSEPSPQAGETESAVSELKVCPSPECQYDKHGPAANFCILCGTLLYQRCDDCASRNVRYANFCYYCGTDLAESRGDEPHRAASEDEDEEDPFHASDDDE